MQVDIHWIDGIGSGRLGIMPRPRGGDWLEDEIRSLVRSGVEVVISLLEREEILELDLLDEQTLCQSNGISFLSFPIPDRSVPSSKQDALEFAQSISKLLGRGKSVVIHCRAGIGRSALIAACALTFGGVHVDEAFRKIESARGCSVPDTEEQRDWVARLAKSL